MVPSCAAPSRRWSAAAEDLFSHDVVGWSPTLVVGSRSALVNALNEREDAFSDIELDVDSLDVVGDKAIAEWRVSAVFSGQFVLDDDLIIEPNGDRLLLAGAPSSADRASA